LPRPRLALPSRPQANAGSLEKHLLGLQKAFKTYLDATRAMCTAAAGVGSDVDAIYKGAADPSAGEGAAALDRLYSHRASDGARGCRNQRPTTVLRAVSLPLLAAAAIGNFTSTMSSLDSRLRRDLDSAMMSEVRNGDEVLNCPRPSDGAAATCRLTLDETPLRHGCFMCRPLRRHHHRSTVRSSARPFLEVQVLEPLGQMLASLDVLKNDMRQRELTKIDYDARCAGVLWRWRWRRGGIGWRGPRSTYEGSDGWHECHVGIRSRKTIPHPGHTRSPTTSRGSFAGCAR
jgi:hypothetical protein